MKQSEDRIKTSNIDEDLFGEDANKESPPFVLYMRSERPTEEVRRMDRNDFYMDDVHSIALEATELIQKRLKEFGIELNDAQEDEIYVPLDATIEKYSNGDYRTYN